MKKGILKINGREYEVLVNDIYQILEMKSKR
jgi:hypothetical protein